MFNRMSLLAMVAVCTLAGSVHAQALTADEKAFFDKHLAEVVTVTPKRLADAAVIKVFATPIYEIAVTVKDGDGGTSDQKQLAARVDDKLVGVTRPGSDGDCPAIQKMFNPSFALLTDDDAKTLQTALDLLYPTYSDDDKKAVSFHHTGTEWTFVRGNFFDKKMGFVLTTDAKGKVTGVKYILKLP